MFRAKLLVPALPSVSCQELNCIWLKLQQVVTPYVSTVNLLQAYFAYLEDGKFKKQKILYISKQSSLEDLSIEKLFLQPGSPLAVFS